MAVPLESLTGRQMISSDAYDMGEVTDIRYDPFEWNVIGLRVKVKRLSGKLAAGIGKTSVLILPEKFILNDVVLLTQTVEEVKGSVIPDNNNASLLSSLISAKVVTRDNMLVGNIVTVTVNTEDWSIPSVVVRLDKGAIEAMKMKKGLFSKIHAEIGTDAILSSTDMVHLNDSMDGVRNCMTILE